MDIKAKLRSTYNRIARKHGAYHRKPWPPVARFLSRVDGDLLDIGAGNCCFSGKVLKKGHKLYAVDFSQEMLNLAPEGTKKIVANATKIPLNRRFRWILSSALIHHLPVEKDRIRFLKEVKRLLARNGEALITAWYGDPGDKMVKWGDTEERYYHFFTEQELDALLKKAGFTNYTIKKSQGKYKPNWIIQIRG